MTQLLVVGWLTVIIGPLAFSHSLNTNQVKETPFTPQRQCLPDKDFQLPEALQAHFAQDMILSLNNTSIYKRSRRCLKIDLVSETLPVCTNWSSPIYVDDLQARIIRIEQRGGQYALEFHIVFDTSEIILPWPTNELNGKEQDCIRQGNGLYRTGKCSLSLRKNCLRFYALSKDRRVEYAAFWDIP